MKGTKYENNWCFYHDVLSQLTCKETIEWMKLKGYYKYWVLPKQELNDGTIFEGCLIGNSPEMMPWDCSLNKDVDDVFQQHRAWTAQLTTDDPLKFCKSTTKQMDSEYLRILDSKNGPEGGAPTSSRIIQDVIKCMGKHLLAIIEAK